jgi:acetate kinase
MYAFFDTSDETQIVRGSIERIGSQGIIHTCNSKGNKLSMPVPVNGGHREAFLAMVDALRSQEVGCIRDANDITAVGHRVVHGGDKLTAPAVVTSEVIAEIEEVSSLAPLHNPVHLIGIREAMKLFPRAPHVAVFDNGFHHTLPPYAYMYGLPYELYKEKKIRRYGFHGTSHFYVSLMASEFLKRPFNALNIVSCHLGNGSSLCAVEHGRSVDTTMGFTPNSGVIMGTRCGELDPGVIVHLMKTENMNADDIDSLINKKGGFLGISGLSNDMREIENAAQQGHHQALLVLKTFCYQIRKHIGSYIAAMQGLDVVVFTGGIGQGSAAVRSLACQGLSCLGIEIDEKKNTTINGFSGVHDISADGSRVRVLVVPTDEERMIAREVLRTAATDYLSGIIELPNEIPVPVEVSAHHVHLAQADVELLFGPGHNLTPKQNLSQPEQFASVETVNLIGPKGRVDRVRVLGPARKETQVEISMTEQYKLGVNPPIRESGDLEHTPGVTLEGPYGSVTVLRGVICALRHIHMTPEDALKFGLRDKNKVRVRVESSRELVFGDVVVRVNPKFKLAMHIDTDEANAANVGKDVVGYIEAIQTAT